MESAASAITRPCALAQIVERPAPALMKEAAALFFDTFGFKLPWPILPADRERAVELIATSVCPEEAYVALDAAGGVIAVAYVSNQGDVLCLDGNALRRVWGPWGSFWRRTAVALARVGSRRSSTLSIEGLAVRADCREAGVGSALLHRIIGDARSSGFQAVSLDVGDDNPGARRLYERFGFRVTRSVWAPNLGAARFRSLVFMRLDL